MPHSWSLGIIYHAGVRRTHTMHLEIAGPPCPPWSRMGRRRRHMDMRFAPHQVWIRWALEIQPHCIIFENVEAHDLQILVANFDAQTWSLQACVLDPRVFGMPLARPRLYCVITLRRSTVWNTTLPLHPRDIECIDPLCGICHKVGNDLGGVWWTVLSPRSPPTLDHSGIAFAASSCRPTC